MCLTDACKAGTLLPPLIIVIGTFKQKPLSKAAERARAKRLRDWLVLQCVDDYVETVHKVRTSHEIS
jgi:hypothetical protein